MATRRPASADGQKRRVVGVADVNMAGGNIRSLRLRVAAQAKIWIVFNEHLLVNGAARVVANDAAFAQSFVFKNERACLGLMTLRAIFVLPRHRQSASRFENIAAVRVVAIHATHVAFNDGMMLRQTEFRMNVEVALKTGFRIFAGIDDELRRTPRADVFAAGAVAGFAAALAGHRGVGKMQARVRTHWKFSDDVRVAIGAGLVADEMRAGNFQGRNDRGRGRGTGNQKACPGADDSNRQRHRKFWF